MDLAVVLGAFETRWLLFIKLAIDETSEGLQDIDSGNWKAKE